MADTDTRDYHLEQLLQEIHSKEKIDEIFKDLQNVFGIADDILVVGYDDGGKDPDDTLYRVLQICRHVNIKLKKDKFHVRCTSVPYFDEVKSRQDVKTDP